MVVPIVVVTVFADVMTNVTRHGSRSPQEPDDLVCTSSCQYKPFWWSRELCMTAGSLSPQLSYVCFEVHMLETNERAPPNVLVCSTNVKAEVPRHGTPPRCSTWTVLDRTKTRLQHVCSEHAGERAGRPDNRIAVSVRNMACCGLQMFAVTKGPPRRAPVNDIRSQKQGTRQ